MRLTFPVLIVGAVTLTGCGGRDLPELGTVSGVVTLDGAPLKDAIVTFTPTADGRPSAGQTDEEGRYELLYVPDEPGALIGQHTVTVRLVVTDEMEGYDPDDPEPGQAPPPTLPPKASDGSLMKDVAAGSNDFDIELTTIEG